jgi:hypothetical protein
LLDYHVPKNIKRPGVKAPFENLSDTKWTFNLYATSVDEVNAPYGVGLKAKQALFLQMAVSKYETYFRLNRQKLTSMGKDGIINIERNEVEEMRHRAAFVRMIESVSANLLYPSLRIGGQLPTCCA